ncbi:MAG: Uma2 family endonuclease [Chloroflexi bacterium]|nr:Uma2 family endonuclease [Chloroflexota bacterium]
MTATIITTDRVSVVAPTVGVVGPTQGQWKYADYAALPEDGNRYEIIQGVLYMAPSPNFGHQHSSTHFVYYLVVQIEQTGLGWVLHAPFDVELGPGNVVQPDILVVLKANQAGIELGKFVGAPDLVVEIASPGTAGYDRRQKQDAYAKAGVPEYWIADPAAQTIEVLILEQGIYQSRGVFADQALLPSQIVPELPIKVAQFFA